MLKPNALLPWESDAYARLEWMPQAVRFKLDLVGAKVGLKQWQQLAVPHRMELLTLPAETSNEIEVWGQKLRDILTVDQAGDFQALPPAGPRQFSADIQAQWKSVGFALTLEKWSKWTEYEQFLAEKTAFSKSAQVPLKEIAPHLGLQAA
jgi:hypothetical protein